MLVFLSYEPWKLHHQPARPDMSPDAIVACLLWNLIDCFLKLDLRPALQKGTHTHYIKSVPKSRAEEVIGPSR